MASESEEVYPVGYLAGLFGTSPDDQTRSIRRGWHAISLTHALDFELWATAHGSLSHDWSMPWTTACVVESLRGSVAGRDEWTAGIVPSRGDISTESAAESFSRLRDRGLLVHVGDSEGERMAFAQTHRFDPLLTGLGNSASHPDQYVIGMRDRPVMQIADSRIELWHMAGQFDSIWSACTGMASAVAGSPGAETSAAELLPRVLSDIRTYIAYGAGYLDAADRSGRRTAQRD